MGCIFISGDMPAEYTCNNTFIGGHKGGDTEYIMRFLMRLLRRLGRRSTGYELTLWPGDKMEYKKILTKRGV